MLDNPQSDPTLQSLEARLAAIPLRLPAHEQQQLLYQSAFAAGQSAGQRAATTTARRWMAATTVIALLTLTLGYRLITLPDPNSYHQHEIRLATPTRPALALPSRSLSAARDESSSQLTVATSFDRVLDFNWPASASTAQSTPTPSKADSPESIITPLSSALPDIL
jgi:hypothetical protein